MQTSEVSFKYHTEYELRSLMDLYIERQEKLRKEIEEAKRDGDVDAELTGEALYKQMRHVIAELFQTMKRIGILDDEEVEFGNVKEVVMDKKTAEKLQKIRSKYILKDPEVQLAINILKQRGVSLDDIEKAYEYLNEQYFQDGRPLSKKQIDQVLDKVWKTFPF